MGTALSPMTTRSRTLLFLSYRDSASRPTRQHDTTLDVYTSPKSKNKGKGKARGPEEISLLERGELRDGEDELDGPVGSEALPPQWVDLSDRVDDILERCQPKIAQLDKLHAKHVLPGFKDRSSEEREIERMTTDITKDFRACHKLIQQIASMAKSMASTSTSSREVLMTQNVQTALATRLQDLSSVFRKKQSNYLKQLQGHEIRTQDILAASGSNSMSRSFAALDEDMKLSHNELQAQSLAMAEPSTSRAVEQRVHEITGIAQSISELAELFKDLSALVIDQGTLLDRVDYNIEQMATDITGAVEELQTATKYQKRSGKKRIMFFLVLLIVGAVLVLVYKPRRRSSEQAQLPSHPPPSQPRPPERFLNRGRLYGQGKSSRITI